jgi:hypothetical protein
VVYERLRALTRSVAMEREGTFALEAEHATSRGWRPFAPLLPSVPGTGCASRARRPPRVRARSFQPRICTSGSARWLPTRPTTACLSNWTATASSPGAKTGFRRRGDLPAQRFTGFTGPEGRDRARHHAGPIRATIPPAGTASPRPAENRGATGGRHHSYPSRRAGLAFDPDLPDPPNLGQPSTPMTSTQPPLIYQTAAPPARSLASDGTSATSSMRHGRAFPKWRSSRSAIAIR